MRKSMRAIYAALLTAFLALSPLAALAQDLPWISEETPPAACSTGFAIAKLRCAGRYCDNIKPSCWASRTGEQRRICSGNCVDYYARSMGARYKGTVPPRITDPNNRPPASTN